VRGVLVVALVAGIAACGDADRVVTSDIASPAIADGCVVPVPRDLATPAIWKVREGDSLRRIARRVYGNESLWKAIRDANPAAVAADGTIRVGAELVIPRSGV
jgi:nucleoid-associated protein YgaU